MCEGGLVVLGGHQLAYDMAYVVIMFRKSLSLCSDSCSLQCVSEALLYPAQVAEMRLGN